MRPMLILLSALLLFLAVNAQSIDTSDAYASDTNFVNGVYNYSLTGKPEGPYPGAPWGITAQSPICEFTDQGQFCPNGPCDTNLTHWHYTKCHTCGKCNKRICDRTANDARCPTAINQCTQSQKRSCSKCQECNQYSCCAVYHHHTTRKWKSRCRDSQNGQESTVSKNRLMGSRSLCKQLTILADVSCTPFTNS